MDEKHRQYCIRLGNPYMGNEQKPYNYDNEEPFWEKKQKEEQYDWNKNKRF